MDQVFIAMLSETQKQELITAINKFKNHESLSN